MTTLQELYMKYGELMVQAEIIQGQMNEVKRLISMELNKPQEKT